MKVIRKMMRLRRPISAALLGVGGLLFVVFAMGPSGSSPTFGDPFSGLSQMQAEFVAGQANFESPDTPQTGLGPVFNNTPCVPATPRVPSAGAAPPRDPIWDGDQRRLQSAHPVRWFARPPTGDRHLPDASRISARSGRDRGRLRRRNRPAAPGRS